MSASLIAEACAGDDDFPNVVITGSGAFDERRRSANAAMDDLLAALIGTGRQVVFDVRAGEDNISEIVGSVGRFDTKGLHKHRQVCAVRDVDALGSEDRAAVTRAAASRGGTRWWLLSCASSASLSPSLTGGCYNVRAPPAPESGSSGGAGKIVTRQDVAKMVKAGVSKDALLRELWAYASERVSPEEAFRITRDADLALVCSKRGMMMAAILEQAVDDVLHTAGSSGMSLASMSLSSDDQ